MDSEKVKEIKKKLQQIDVNDILTLINELESENERLKILLAQANAGNVNCIGCRLVELNAVKEFAEKLKMAFYYEFDEIMPSIMSDKIDKLLKEYEK